MLFLKFLKMISTFPAFSPSFTSLSDQGCLWLDQSLQVHIQDQPVTEKVTDRVSS